MPFTVEQFLDVFGKYNLAIWPRQLLFYLIVILTLILAVKKTNYSDKVISAILSFFWLWMGVVYHLLYEWIFEAKRGGTWRSGARPNMIWLWPDIRLGLIRNTVCSSTWCGYRNIVGGYCEAKWSSA